MSAPRIVVAGPAASGKRTIARGLLHLNELHPQPIDAEDPAAVAAAAAAIALTLPPPASPGSDGAGAGAGVGAGAGAAGGAGSGSGGAAYPFTMRTKYYTAALEFHVVPAAEFAMPGDAATAAMEGAEGIVLVLEAGQVRCSGRAARARRRLGEC